MTPNKRAPDFPHNLEAERCVLGAVLVDEQQFAAAAELVSARDFYRDAHGRIWRTMADLSGRGDAIDLVTISDELTRRAELDTVGGPAFIASLTDGVPRASNVGEYAKIVQHHARARDLINLCERTARALRIDPAVIGNGLPGAHQADLEKILSRLAGAERSTTWLRAAEVMRAAPPIEVVEGIAWAGCLSVLVGESGAGKTFVSADLAAAVSAGEPWHGRQTRTGTVVYLGFEGDDLGRRLRAIQDAKSRRLDHVIAIRGSDPLSPRVTRDGEESSVGERRIAHELDDIVRVLAKAGEPPVTLIIIDTVRASLAGSEDSSEHVSAYLRAVRRIMSRVPSAACILSHHAGWQDGAGQRKRERGSSAWRGNVDATFYLEAGAYDATRGEMPLTLRTLKVRDAEKRAPLHLTRKRVDLDERDQWGAVLTSCVIEMDRRSRETREAEQKQAEGAAQRQIDVRVLRVIEATNTTSQTSLASAVGARKAEVGASLARIIQAGWVAKESHKAPFTITEDGRAELMESGH